MASRLTTVNIGYRNSRTNKSYNMLDSRVEEVTITDSAVGDGDNIDVTLNDKDLKMLRDYYPGSEDMIYCKISAKISRGKQQVFETRTFHVDQFGYSSPSKFTLRGISVPRNSEFSKTPKTKTWQNDFSSNIILKICQNYGLKLVYEHGTYNPYLSKIEQSNATDLSFIYNLARTFGNGFKIYSDKVVVFPEENYENKNPIRTINKEDILDNSLNARFELTRQYTGYIYSYRENNVDIRTGSYFITKPSIMVDVGFSETKEIGIMKGRAKVNEANRDLQIINFKILGDPKMVSMATFNLSGFGALNGKYYINKTIINFSSSGGLTQEIEARKIQQRKG